MEGQVRQHVKLHPAVFDPGTIHILSDALDDAWQVVQANQSKFKIDGDAEAARTLLAKHIVDMAKNGERDRQCLTEGALKWMTTLG